MSDTSLNRRDFLKAAAASSATIALAPALAQEGNAPKLPQRTFKDDAKVSIIGFPGLCLRGLPQEQANKAVARAYEMGVAYYDVAPEYGNSQDLLGPALEPYRKNCFLACKTAMRTAEKAKAELDRSLKLLKTDRFELYQLHHIRDPKKDVEVALGKGGAMEVILEAKMAGVIRYIGFSAHTQEAAVAAMEQFPFDSALFPVNIASWYTGGFGPKIMETAKAKGVVRLAMKSLCRQVWPQNDPLRKKFPRCWYQPVTDANEQQLSVRWTLSQDVSASVPPADVELLWVMVEKAMNFRALDEKEMQEAQALAKTLNPLFRTDRVVRGDGHEMHAVA